VKFPDILLTGLDPKLTVPENLYFERYKAAFKWLGVGTVSLAAGVAGDTLGIKDSLGLVEAGAAVILIGNISIHASMQHLFYQDK
jgi:hypothetical protein